MTVDEFISALKEADIILTKKQIQQFEQYFNMLVATNENVNLTAITNQPDVYLKHFYDSLTIAFYEKDLQLANKSLIDIGAGAGFPSLPLRLFSQILKLRWLMPCKNVLIFCKKL